MDLWNSAYPVVSSILAYPEGRAALAAVRRGARVGHQQYASAVAKFASHYEDLVTVGVDHALSHAAGAYAEEFSLRGYDAVHLASAQSLGEEEVVMVTWDADLARAASEAGLIIAGTL